MRAKSGSATEFEGMFIEVLEYINAKSKDKIRFKISPLVEFEYGREYSPGNWSGLIGAVQDEKDIIEVSINVYCIYSLFSFPVTC
jgi:hypothetical protein